ncbi:hypothetical protein WG906_17405 [Pedobacter sp. P351]|uniref:hypothetical protein n=1 Tax=Pedobacter superstes TaxID=3133441 RepID=UPI003096F4F5
MSTIRLFITGAAFAAGVHYITKKRPDGSSIIEDIKSKLPEWMNKAQPFIDQWKGQFSNVPHIKGSAAKGGTYPRKFENSSADPDPDYSS